MKLTASRLSTRTLQKGERIGYGGDFTAPEAMTVSTYDIGYGDGWCRGSSDAPYVTAEGLPLLGRVSMDMVSLESDREEVVIFDDAQKAAEQFGTISYEVMTALSPAIKRVVME
jgi:alanine racemase